MATRPRICPDCGLIDLPVEIDRCPTCGMTTLDPDDPESHLAVETVVDAHRGLATWARAPRTIVVALYLWVILVVAWGAYPVGGQLVGVSIVLAGALFLTVLRPSPTPAWRAAIARGCPEIEARARWSATSSGCSCTVSRWTNGSAAGVRP